MGVGGQRHAPAALPPGKTRYPIQFTGGWAGPRANMDGCGKSRPYLVYISQMTAGSVRHSYLESHCLKQHKVLALSLIITVKY